MSFLEILPQKDSKGPSTSQTGGNLGGAVVGCTGRLYNWGWHQGEWYIWSLPFQIAGIFNLLFHLIRPRCFIKVPKHQHLTISLASATLHVQMSSEILIMVLFNCSEIHGITHLMCWICRSALRQRRKPSIRWLILVPSWLDRWSTTLS